MTHTAQTPALTFHLHLAPSSRPLTLPPANAWPSLPALSFGGEWCGNSPGVALSVRTARRKKKKKAKGGRRLPQSASVARLARGKARACYGASVATNRRRVIKGIQGPWQNTGKGGRAWRGRGGGRADLPLPRYSQNFQNSDEVAFQVTAIKT